MYKNETALAKYDYLSPYVVPYTCHVMSCHQSSVSYRCHKVSGALGARVLARVSFQRKRAQYFNCISLPADVTPPHVQWLQ